MSYRLHSARSFQTWSAWTQQRSSRSCGTKEWRRNLYFHDPKRTNVCKIRSGFGEMLSKGLRGLLNKEETVAEDVQQIRFLSNNAPSWTELESLMKEKGTAMDDVSLTQADYLETGPPNPLSLKRTFGSTEPIRVKLYRDHAAWCPYCQKKINMRCYGPKPESFYAIVPSGLLPVLELDGKVFTESAVIADLLEASFPETPLLPPEGSEERSRCPGLFRLERRVFSDWCGWLCTSSAPRQRQANFEATMELIESELGVSSGPFFLEDFSLVDIVFAPFLERMDASLTFYKGFRMRTEGRYPNLERWFAGMESRPTYIATRSDYFTHCYALPPQLGGCEMTSEGEPFADKICGVKDGTWTLPLEPLSASSFEPYSPGDNPEKDTYRAAKRLIQNHENIVKFALRGCGEEGKQPVMAPLSDPTAEPGFHAFGEVDMALRHVSHALLVGVETKQNQDLRLNVDDSPEENFSSSENIIPSMIYLRDRVGVPRDLKFPEARQLRAHLNWLVDLVT